MNTVQLECFLEVASCLNFSKAATNLKMTQPAVSHQIHSLESELGTKLFNRTSKSVELTQNGILFIGPASDALKILGSAKARMGEKDSFEMIPIKIGCHNQEELNVLVPILKALAKEIPSACPTITLAPFAPATALLENDAVDIMFSVKSSDPLKKKIIYKELYKCDMVCICSQDHPLAQHESLSVEQLQGKMAIFQRQKDTKELYRIIHPIMGSLPQSQLYFCDRYECALPLVRAGLCYCIVPDVLTEREKDLRYIPLERTPKISFGMYYSTWKANPLLKKFIEITTKVTQEKN